MSTILKALRRLEEETQASAEHDLRGAVVDETPAAPVGARAPGRWLGWGFAALTGALGAALIGGVGLWLWSSEEVASPAVAAPGSELAAPRERSVVLGERALKEGAGPTATARSAPRPVPAREAAEVEFGGLRAATARSTPRPVPAREVAEAEPRGLRAAAAPVSNALASQTLPNESLSTPTPTRSTPDPTRPTADRPAPRRVAQSAAVPSSPAIAPPTPEPDVRQPKAEAPRVATSSGAASSPRQASVAKSQVTSEQPPVSAQPPPVDLALVERGRSEGLGSSPDLPARVEASDPQREIGKLHVIGDVRETPERVASSSVPAIFRSSVPEVSVKSIRWHPKTERRTAEVDVPAEGQVVTVHEGDAIGPLVVAEITLSGVVFRHEDVEILRRVGESNSVK